MYLKKRLLALGVAAAAGFSAAPASATLDLQTPVQLQGQGVGAQFTTLFLQGAGNNTTESGGVNFNGSVFGDAGSGNSQSRTFTFGDLGITNANQLGLIVNLAEPGSENPPSVNTANSVLTGTQATMSNTISLNVFSSTGTLLETHTAAAGLQLNQVAGGLGGSGLLFALSPAEVTQLNATIANNAGTEVFTTGATFANAQGGPETIAAARLTAIPPTAIPEPETYAMMLAGLGLLGFVGSRRKKS